MLETIYGSWGLVAILFVVCWFANNFTVRGTKLRYTLRTIIRPLQWVAVAYFVVDVGVQFATGDFFSGTLNIYNTLWISWSIKKFYESDEDDWFKKTKKRLKAWAKRKLESISKIRVPQVIPVPQGA